LTDHRSYFTVTREIELQRLNLVQVNFSQGPVELNAYYLPYTAGVLWSYAARKPAVRNSWELGEIAWRRDPIDSIYKRLADCDLVGFSTYIWNKNYNYALARKIKEYNPNCRILFGGPEPPVEAGDLFERFPFMDYVIKKEGEISFANLLSGDLHAPGLLINDGGKVRDTGIAARINQLDDLPSPYTTGVFDKIIDQNPTVTWNATLETNRGCPYQCTFCDWGSLTYNKVKKFDLQRVYDEIEWIGKHRCDWMTITDANFGMFVERDDAIVDRVIYVQNRYGYPRRMGLSWAKNQKAEVVRLARKLTNTGFNNGLTLSVQSLDDGVLSAIKRRNLEINKLEEVFDLCNRAGLSVNTELILGLPGETVDTWRSNVWQLLEIDQHNGIEFFQAQLLENAEMNLMQKESHQLTSVTVYDYMSGNDSADDISEGVEVVTSTKDLSSQDMLACQEFQWFINTWHINGISQWYSRFLRSHASISYEQFYTGFAAHLETLPWYRAERDSVMSAYRRWIEQGTISMEPVAGVKIHGWNLIHLTNLRMHSSGCYEQFHAAVSDHVRSAYGQVIDNCMIADLGMISRHYVIQHSDLHRYPADVMVSHNMIEHVLEGAALTKRTELLRFEFPEDSQQPLSVFLQNIYYARRRNFGKARIVRL
jgi:tRNA A37 methylthiotransferase MiaB